MSCTRFVRRHAVQSRDQRYFSLSSVPFRILLSVPSKASSLPISRSRTAIYLSRHMNRMLIPVLCFPHSRLVSRLCLKKPGPHVSFLFLSRHMRVDLSIEYPCLLLRNVHLRHMIACRNAYTPLENILYRPVTRTSSYAHPCTFLRINHITESRRRALPLPFVFPRSSPPSWTAGDPTPLAVPDPGRGRVAPNLGLLDRGVPGTLSRPPDRAVLVPLPAAPLKSLIGSDVPRSSSSSPSSPPSPMSRSPKLRFSILRLYAALRAWKFRLATGFEKSGRRYR